MLTGGDAQECPNGGTACKYRHALPPGFVLKSQRKRDEEAAKKAVISIEEFIESERHRLPKTLTPVTKESFAEWKVKRVEKKEAEEDTKQKVKAASAAAGRMTGMSGRDLFTCVSLRPSPPNHTLKRGQVRHDRGIWRRRVLRRRGRR